MVAAAKPLSTEELHWGHYRQMGLNILLTNLLGNLNYAAEGSPEHSGYRARIDGPLKTLRRPAVAPRG